jgi:hypothetical protein
LGTNDGPILTVTSVSSDGPSSKLTVSSGGWPGAVVGDWVTFQYLGGTARHTAVITSISGNDAYISPAPPDEQSGDARVGGAWPDIPTAFTRLASIAANWNTNSYTQKTIARVNVKYDPSAYAQSSLVDHSVWGDWPRAYGFRVEGYYALPGDLRGEDPRTSCRFPVWNVTNTSDPAAIQLTRGCLACMEINRTGQNQSSATPVVKLVDSSGGSSVENPTFDRCRVVSNGNTGAGAPAHCVEVDCPGAKILDTYARRAPGTYNDLSAGIRINSGKNNVRILGSVVEGPSATEGGADTPVRYGIWMANAVYGLVVIDTLVFHNEVGFLIDGAHVVVHGGTFCRNNLANIRIPDTSSASVYIYTGAIRGNILADALDLSANGLAYLSTTRVAQTPLNFNVFRSNPAGAYKPGALIEQNDGNIYLQPSEALFANLADADFRLACDSPARGASRGRDPGALPNTCCQDNLAI